MFSHLGLIFITTYSIRLVCCVFLRTLDGVDYHSLNKEEGNEIPFK